MKGKMKIAQKGGLIETYLTMGKSASLFTRTRQTEDSTLRELKPLSKAFQMLFF